MPTLTTNPIPHDQIPDAGVVAASAKLLGRQGVNGNPTTLEFDIGLILDYIAANLDSTTAAELAAALTQYHKKGDLIADTDIPNAIARDSEVSAAIAAALVGYLTQTEGDARYPLLSGLSEAIDDRVGALLVAGANIALTYDDTTNTLTISSSASGSGHTIQDEATNLTQRSKLAFVGAGVTATDDVSGDRTVVSISGSGSAGNFLSLPLLVSDPAAIAGQTVLFARANGFPHIRISDGTVYPLTLGASVTPIGGGTSYVEDFSGANGSNVIGRAWSLGTWQSYYINTDPIITSNKGTSSSGTGTDSAIINISSTSYTVKGTYTVASSSTYVGLFFRGFTSSPSNAETWYLYLLNNNIFVVSRTVSGTDTNQYVAPYATPSIPFVLEAVVNAGSVQILIDGVLITTITSSLYSGNTYAGFFLAQGFAANTVDNFTVIN